jgi:hypothetical protein
MWFLEYLANTVVTTPVERTKYRLKNLIDILGTWHTYRMRRFTMEKYVIIGIAVIFMTLSSIPVLADNHMSNNGNNENVITCKALLAGGEAAEAFADVHGVFPSDVFKNIGQCVSYFANGGFEKDHSTPEE